MKPPDEYNQSLPSQVRGGAEVSVTFRSHQLQYAKKVNIDSLSVITSGLFNAIQQAASG